jgi:hypothetical protein
MTSEKYVNYFKEINDAPSGNTVSFDQRNDGFGIAVTLRSHNANYHKTCMSYCSSSHVKRLCQKQNTRSESSKKGSAGTPHTHTPRRNVKYCVICESHDQYNIPKVVTDNIDTNLKSWAKSNNIFQLVESLIAQAVYAHAGDHAK